LCPALYLGVYLFIINLFIYGLGFEWSGAQIEWREDKKEEERK